MPGAAAASAEIEINAPVARVWDVLADLESVAIWSPTVVAATVTSSARNGLGARREVRFSGRAHLDRVIRDVVVEWHDRSGYLVESTGIRALRRLRSRWSVQAGGNGTVATLVFLYEPPWGIFGQWVIGPVLGRSMASSARQILAGLKAYVETGQTLPKV